MKRAVRCVLVLSALFAAGTVRAQESPDRELEFVRKLREKGYLDLAQEYATRLKASKDPTLQSALPLEEARTLLAIAREKDAEQRAGMFAAARKSLQDYVDKNKGKPEAAQGSLEIARLSSYEGQALLTKALREMEVSDQQKLAKPAEAKFEQAAKDLDIAAKMIEDLAANYKNPDEAAEKAAKRRLQQDLTQARFDKGAVLIDQARTYIETSKEEINTKRAAIIQLAKKVFTPLVDADTPSVAYLAGAWLMKISMEEQAPDDTKRLHARITGLKDAEARPAQRWARYFNMQDMLANSKNPLVAKLKTPEQKYRAVQKEGVAWLKDYPSYVKAPEGQGVLWELANAYYLEAQGLKDQKAKTTQDLYDLAQKHYQTLAQTDGDYSEKANQVNLSISFLRMGDRKEFRTFEDHYLKAQYEMLRMRQAAAAKNAPDAKDIDKLEKEWKDRLRQVTRTLNRTVGLATPRTPLAKLDEARYYLTSAYLIGGDPYRAAVAGEALGRTKPPTRRAPAGAAYAIESYASILARDNDDITRGRLKGLIDYALSPEMQKYWAGDQVVSVAHYQLAMLHHKDKKFKEAIKLLEQLPQDFPAYVYAQGQLVFIAEEARDDANVPPGDKPALKETAKQALRRIPTLPADADPSTATMYFFAHLEMPKFLYGEAHEDLDKKEPFKANLKFKQMGILLDGLSKQLDKLPVKLSPKTREKLDFQIAVLKKYSNLGRAEVEYREGKFDKVLDYTKPTVDKVAAADKGNEIRLKDVQVTGDVLGLALRAQVQKGNAGEAKKLLGVLKRLRGEEDNSSFTDSSSGVVGNLLRDVAVQFRTLKKEGDEPKLKALVGSFGAFLDELVKDYDPKKAAAKELQLLGEAYTSLDQHQKAADLYGQVPAPAALGAKSPKDVKEKELAELQDYWVIKLRQAESLRRAKDYKGALKVIDDALKHPNAMFQIYFDMEKNFTYEDDAKYGFAVQRWNAFMKNPGLVKDLQNPRSKRLYFEGYFYQVRCLYKYAQHDPGVKDRGKLVNFAAKQLLKLEHTPGQEGWGIVGDRFVELMNAEPTLKAEYDRLRPEYAKAEKVAQPKQ